MSVKTGDLAIQIKSYAGNEGSIVTVGAHLGPTLFAEPTGLADAFEIFRARPAAHRHPIMGLIKMEELRRVMPTAWLKPISGLPEAEDVNTEAPIAENVK